MSEKRLVYANEVLKGIEAFMQCYAEKEKELTPFWVKVAIQALDMVRQLIKEMPAVDAVKVVHAQWIRKQLGKHAGADEVCCSNCGSFLGVVCSDTGFEEAVKGMNYCNNCGAIMDLKEKV